MASEEETFRRLVVELRVFEGTAETIQSRINLVNAALTELQVASMTLEGLEQEKKGASLVVPIGAGSYVKTSLASADRVIVGLGADVAIEQTLNEAKEKLGTRIAGLEKTRINLGEQLSQILERIQEHQTKLQELTAKLGRKERTGAVRKNTQRI